MMLRYLQQVQIVAGNKVLPHRDENAAMYRYLCEFLRLSMKLRLCDRLRRLRKRATAIFIILLREVVSMLD